MAFSFLKHCFSSFLLHFYESIIPRNADSIYIDMITYSAAYVNGRKKTNHSFVHIAKNFHSKNEWNSEKTESHPLPCKFIRLSRVSLRDDRSLHIVQHFAKLHIELLRLFCRISLFKQHGIAALLKEIQKICIFCIRTDLGQLLAAGFHFL